MQGKGGGEGGGGGCGGPKGGGQPGAQSKREPGFIDKDNNGVDDRDEQDGAAPFAQEGAINGLDQPPGFAQGAVQEPQVEDTVPSSPSQPESSVASAGPEVVPTTPGTKDSHTGADAGNARPPSKPEPGVSEEKQVEKEKSQAEKQTKTAFDAFGDSLVETGKLGLKVLGFRGLFDGQESQKAKE